MNKKSLEEINEDNYISAAGEQVHEMHIFTNRWNNNASN